MEKKPNTAVVPAYVPSAAAHWWKFELWDVCAIMTIWDGATINVGANPLLMYFSCIDDPQFPAGSSQYNGLPNVYTGGTVDLDQWTPQSGFSWTGPAASAAGSQIIPVSLHGARWCLLGTTFTAATDQFSVWVSGYNR